MTELSVGVQLHPQATSMADLLDATTAADELGMDSVWIWDHFYPLYGDPDATHFECYTTLAAMAARSQRAKIGALVTCNSYRNPNLLADMSRTIDHISNGRFILGIGSGWFERDYEEYDYEFGTAIGRLRALERDLPIIKARLDVLNPTPVGKVPILIGGSGEKVTLRLVAQYADAWNTFGPVDHFQHKNAVLNEHCATVGRDPSEIERTVAIGPHEIDQIDDFIAAGANHIILQLAHPFALDGAARLLELANERRAG